MRYSNNHSFIAGIKWKGWTVSFICLFVCLLFFFLIEEDPPVTHDQRTRFINLDKWWENNFGLWDNENKLFI